MVEDDNNICTQIDWEDEKEAYKTLQGKCIKVNKMQSVHVTKPPGSSFKMIKDLQKKMFEKS